MGPPLVDADWYAFCQALYWGIEGKDWEEMCDSYKVMSKAVGVKKPQEAQKEKALWAMKADKDRKETFYDPAREEDNATRNKNAIGIVGGASQGSDCRAGHGTEVRWRSVLKLARGFVKQGRNDQR